MLIMCSIVFSASVFAQTTAFTYQGSLKDGAAGATGTYEMQFSLFDASADGNPIGSIITNPNVSVLNGVFSVELDFASSSYSGADRWLEIRVKKTAEASYTTLSPRQKIASVPYAVRALNATNARNSTTAADFSGTLSGDISGTQNATNVGTVGGKTATQISTSVDDTLNATSANTAGTIVKRDALGGFSAGLMTVTNTRLSLVTGNDGSALRIVNTSSGGSVQQGIFAQFRSYLGSSTTLTDRFRFDQTGGFVANGELGFSIIPETGPGVRMMWYPSKAAFRVGGVDGYQWSDSNTGFYSMASGYNTVAHGNYSVALGSRARTGCQFDATADCPSTFSRNGSFIFGDNSNTSSNFDSTADNQFSVRAAGGYRLFSNNTLTTGVTLSAGGGAWTTVSDRNAKENFGAVNSRDVLRKVLKLPITTWNYKGQTYRHIGAMAQDFYSTFNVGENDKTITTVDPDGVALAAIQGLNEELKDRDKKIEQQQQQITQLQEQAQRQQTIIDEMKKLLCVSNPSAGICK